MAGTVLRICLDVNVWIAHFLAVQKRRQGGSATTIVNIVGDMKCDAGPVQLVLSWEMLATLEDVLGRLHFHHQHVANIIADLIGLMKSGPEQFAPSMLPDGGKSLPLRDTEDAGVLASSIATRADLLITNNLIDFAHKDCERIETRLITIPGQPPRRLYALIYERNDGVQVIIAHPIDAVAWLQLGLRPTPDAIRKFLPPPTPPNIQSR